MKNITKQELQLLINKIGLTKAAKNLKCGYETLKKECKNLNIIVAKKPAGRPKNLKIS